MAAETNIQSGGSCPVAALVDEARKLQGAYAAADWGLKHDPKNFRLEAMRDAAFAFRDGLEDRATFLRAASAKGAMFQLSILGNLVDELAGYAEAAQRNGKDWRPDVTQPAHDKANRLLHSVARYLETLSGTDIEEAIGECWLPRKTDPFEELREALALAAAQESSERVGK